MNTGPLDRLVASWRDEAELNRRRGMEREALTVESYADELQEQVREWKLEVLTLEQAAAETGVTADTVGRRISRGEIPNAGRKNRPGVRRCDLFGALDRPVLKLQAGEPDVATEMLQREL